MKAWSGLLFGKPPVIEVSGVNFAEIQVLADAYNRPQLVLSGQVATSFAASVSRAGSAPVKADIAAVLNSQAAGDCELVESVKSVESVAGAEFGIRKSIVHPLISLSHDGDYAIAYVQLAAGRIPDANSVSGL
ncbi:hypothetical protein RQN30_11865 [Arcanobacterium hippocoleae]